MNSLIKNFSQWRALYEAETPVQPLEKDKPLPENQAKVFGMLGSDIMKRLCLTLLAKSETVSGHLDPAKDSTGTKDVGTGTYKYFTTAPFIDTEMNEPLSGVNTKPTPTVDPAVFGRVEDQVTLTANRAAAVVKVNGIPGSNLAAVDFSKAKADLDNLIASSAKRVSQSGFGSPALQHPMFPLGGQITDKGNINRIYDDILIKDFAYNGGRVMKSSDRIEPNTRGLTVSLSKEAGNTLIQIATEIINAIVPAEYQNVRDIMIRMADPGRVFGIIQKKGLSRKELANNIPAFDKIYYPKQAPDYTIKGYSDESAPSPQPATPNPNPQVSPALPK